MAHKTVTLESLFTVSLFQKGVFNIFPTSSPSFLLCVTTTITDKSKNRNTKLFLTIRKISIDVLQYHNGRLLHTCMCTGV